MALALHPLCWSCSRGAWGSVPHRRSQSPCSTPRAGTLGDDGGRTPCSSFLVPEGLAWAQKWGGAGLRDARLSCHTIRGPGLRVGEMAEAWPHVHGGLAADYGDSFGSTADETSAGISGVLPAH